MFELSLLAQSERPGFEGSKLIWQLALILIVVIVILLKVEKDKKTPPKN